MPNWVYNTLHCHGTEEELDALAAFFTRDIEVHTWNSEMGTSDLVTKTVPFTYQAMRDPFSAPYNVSHEEYHATNGYSNGVQTGNTPDNWYNWNNRNWGVKWDASVNEVVRNEGIISYYFDSPWGPPLSEMLLDMSTHFPNISFTHNYEEEQGWGGEYEFQNGEVSEEREWDIPSCHAEYVELGQTCACEIWTDDSEMWYSDCPAKIAHEKSLTIV